MRFCLALTFFACALSAQIDPAAAELRQKAADFNRSADSYSMEVQMTVQTDGPVKNSMEMPMSMKWSKPDKLRVESKSPVGTMTIVSDGKASFIYMTGSNQYIKREASFSPEMVMQMSGLNTNPTSNLKEKTQKVVRDESLVIDGRSVPCSVVETEYSGTTEVNGMKVKPGKTVSWLAKTNGMMLRMQSSSVVEASVFPTPLQTSIRMDVTKMTLGEKFPDSDFSFTPPTGAKEIQQMAGLTFANGKPEMLGKPLPALKLTTLDGKPFDIAQLKGKTVLLNFWTTWCGPCRSEIPDLKKLHSEWKDSDTVILGVDMDEDVDTVKRAINDLKINYPVVRAAGAENKEMGIHAYPTQVVIDPAGVILKYEIGRRTEEAFRMLVGGKKITAEIR